MTRVVTITLEYSGEKSENTIILNQDLSSVSAKPKPWRTVAIDPLPVLSHMYKQFCFQLPW